MKKTFRISTAAFLIVVLLMPGTSFCKNRKLRDHRFQQTAFALEKNPQWKALLNSFGPVNIKERGDAFACGDIFSLKLQIGKGSDNLKEFLMRSKTARLAQKPKIHIGKTKGTETLVRKLQSEADSEELKQFLKDASALR